MEDAESAGLHYVSDSSPGIQRRRQGKGFSYRDPKQQLVTKPSELDRIHKLAIPPAYQKVWICVDAKGHLQATGIDARGRKQYRYHPLFREARDEHKFGRMAQFGKALPKLRECVDRDLALKGFPKAKVVAAVVYLLERSLIRVGNEEYAKSNNSFGLTTMLSRHVRIQGSKIEFKFLGKSKIEHDVEIHDKRLAKIVKKIQDLPGQELFHYIGDDGQATSISSADVNHYLHECTGEHFTAKDFRTWWGSLLAMAELSGQEVATTKVGLKRAITATMKRVSFQLGNTPTICRKCYVHPAVVKAFEGNALKEFRGVDPACPDDYVAAAESALLKLLKG